MASDTHILYKNKMVLCVVVKHDALLNSIRIAKMVYLPQLAFRVMIGRRGQTAWNEANSRGGAGIFKQVYGIISDPWVAPRSFFFLPFFALVCDLKFCHCVLSVLIRGAYTIA